ncbi:MAG: PqqD family protein [Planctomycetes bacterium]|nr:PqqD family protein [Planctomycetota bacterium]
MKLRTHIQWQQKPGSGYLFDPQTGNLFALNATANLVLRALEHCHNRDEIVHHLLQMHPDASASQPSFSKLALSDDLAAFLQLLQDHDLIQL